MRSTPSLMVVLLSFFVVAISAEPLHADVQLDLMFPPEMRFDAVALSDAIEFLHDINGASISVDWKALEAVGVTRKTLITISMQKVKFSKALRLILDAA